MKTKKSAILVSALMLCVTIVSAQNRGGSTDVQAAREELNAILDLGRFLGFIHTMSTEEDGLRLSDGQARELLEITRSISNASRLTGDTAETYMMRIEDGILSGQQLVYTDRLWIASDRERANSSGSPTATTTAQQRSGSGRSPDGGTGTPQTPGSAERPEPTSDLAEFAAGGAFNPLMDPERPQGASFRDLQRYLEGRVTGR